MSVGAYAFGVALLAAILVPPALAATRARARLFPAASWALSRTIEAIVALSLLLGLAHILGSVGLFRSIPMALASIAISATVYGLCRGGGAGEKHAPSAPTQRMGILLAGAAVAVVAAAWVGQTAPAVTHGMGTVDTLRYHLPFAAEFIQRGEVLSFKEVGPNPAVSFQSEDAELLDGIVMLPFDRDIAATLVNLFWLALALVAAWALGERGGVPVESTLAAALTMGVGLMVHTQAGTAGNDAAPVALLLAAVALLLNMEPGIWPPLLAGAAMGMAIGTKLYAVPVAVVLTVGIPFLAERGRRLVVLTAFAAGEVLTGAFWILRNLFSTGSPLPTLAFHLGPIKLAHPASTVEPLGFTVWQYIFHPGFLTRYAPDDLYLVMGAVWPFMVILPLIGLTLGFLPSTIRGLRLVALAGWVAAVAYLFTPWGALTFPGFLDNPVLFGANFRYFLPAAAIGLAILPLTTPLQRPKLRLAFAVGLVVLILVAQLTPGGKYGTLTGADLRAAAAVMAVTAAVTAVLVLRTRFPRRLTAAGLAVAVVVIVAAGFPLERRNEVSRYMTGQSNQELFRWAHSLASVRIGHNGFQTAYPLYGIDLSNHVEFIGTRKADGDFVPPATCREWRSAARQQGYDYLVVQSLPGATAPELQWTRDDPSATEILRDASLVVFSIHQPMNPDGCA